MYFLYIFLFNLGQTTVPVLVQTYVKNHLWAKAFPTSEDRSLGTGDMSGQGDCLKVKNIHPKLKPVKDIERLIIIIKIT
jgi:hypothetical protein